MLWDFRDILELCCPVSSMWLFTLKIIQIKQTLKLHFSLVTFPVLHSNTGLVATVVGSIATEYLHHHKVLLDAIEMGESLGLQGDPTSPS